MKSARIGIPWSLDGAMIAFVAVLFGFAGIDKLLHAPGFVRAINDYALIPIPAGAILAPAVIASELAVAIGLFYGPWRRVAAISGAGLMVIFSIGLIGNHLAGAKGICGCWFSINMGQGNSHFVLNAVLIGLCVLIARSSPGQQNSVATTRLPSASHASS